jgi:hypothetical protein
MRGFLVALSRPTYMEEGFMRKIAVSALALAAMSSVAVAEPAKLSDNELDQVTAGQIQIGAVLNTGTAVAVGCVAFCESENTSATVQQAGQVAQVANTGGGVGITQRIRQRNRTGG